MKYYFFKTHSEKGRNRLRPLTGQVFDDGIKIDTTMNINANKTIRTMYPLGTIFGSATLMDTTTHYTAGEIFPMLHNTEDYVQTDHIPPSDMQVALKVFMGLIDEPLAVPEEPTITVEPITPRITFLDRMRDNKELQRPTLGTDGFFVEPDNWFLLLRNILNQVNTLLVGPTGTGKTELIILACQKLGISCSVYDMGSMYDPISGLLGVHRLQEGGVSVFDYAKFTEDISKPGVILLDELSRAPVTTNNILFPCLDSRRKLPIEIAGGNDLREVEVHEDCTFIATANIGAEYTGTMSMDKALVNRFFPIELDYLPEKDEVGLLKKRCRIEHDMASTIVKVTSEVRSLYKKQELSTSLSTREALMVGDLVSDGWTPLKAMELVFLPLFEGSNMEGERGIVRKIFMSR